MYAKIDSQGNVIEFPVFSEDPISLLPNKPLPSDWVEVDTETNKPKPSWNIRLDYDRIERVGDKYILNYISSEQYLDFESKKAGITHLLKIYANINETTFKLKEKEVISEYPQEEINTWSLQLSEAKNYLNGVDDYAFISKLALERGIELSELVTKIISRHGAYVESYGALLGRYQRNRQILSSIDLNDETTFDLIDQYGWEE